MKSQKGFTLIELLVVIAIIGILSSVVLASLNSARSKARDAKRMSDINQMIKAIEMYYNDYGYYPLSGGIDGCTTTVGAPYSDCAVLGIVPNYMKNTPVDPTNILNEYGYYYHRKYKPNATNTGYISTNNDQNYIIATRLENTSNAIFWGWQNPNLNLIKGQ
jgi:type II secretion system protein G